ncbi:MAG TPA: hypothetical protein VF545_00575 [Thermoleophilaceae bacterium]|jgi:predicted small lipoprotein YifL
MPRGAKPISALAALAALVSLAGCGGDSGPSKAEFAKKADALCAKTNRDNPPKPAPNDAKAAAAQQAAEIQVRTELDRKLTALDAPEGLTGDLEAYHGETQKIIAVIGRMKAAADRGDEKLYGTQLRAFDAESVKREKIAVKLGFKVCGRKNPKPA